MNTREKRIAIQKGEKVATDRGISEVFMICDAYESGMGHGLQRDGLPNPYTPLGTLWEAYAIGYDLGSERAARKANGRS